MSLTLPSNTPIQRTVHQAYINIAARLPIEDIKMLQRLDRGRDILTGYGYRVVRYDSDKYIVHKESTSLLEDNSVSYTVDSEGCTCPDYETARAGLCKHRLAVMIVDEMVRCAPQQQ